MEELIVTARTDAGYTKFSTVGWTQNSKRNSLHLNRNKLLGKNGNPKKFCFIYNDCSSCSVHHTEHELLIEKVLG